MRKAISAIVVAVFSLGLVSQTFGTAVPSKKTSSKPEQKPASVRTISSKTPAESTKVLSLVHRSDSGKITEAKHTSKHAQHKAKISHTGKNKSKSKQSTRHINKTKDVKKSSLTNEKSGSRV